MISKNTGQTVHHLSFSQIDFVEQFDGIWANASLLHVPGEEVDNVMRRLIRALRPRGVFYASVKQGDGERSSEDGRYFYDYSEGTMRALFARHPSLELISIDASPAGEFQSDRWSWLHGTARKR